MTNPTWAVLSICEHSTVGKIFNPRSSRVLSAQRARPRRDAVEEKCCLAIPLGGETSDSELRNLAQQRLA